MVLSGAIKERKESYRSVGQPRENISFSPAGEFKTFVRGGGGVSLGGRGSYFLTFCVNPQKRRQRERERDTPPIERMHTTRQSVSTYVSVTKRERERDISVANSLLLVFLSALTPQWDRKQDIVHTKD